MRRFFVLSVAVACLGGCSCKGKPGPSPSANDAGLASRPASESPAPPSPPPIPEGAAKLHAQGREHGRAGRFEEALKHFHQARELAPDWLLPDYDIGHTYVLMKEDARALAAFERLDARAPQGFADGKLVLDCLRREREGRVPAGTYRKYLEVQQLQDMKEVRRRLKELTRTAPGFVPAWKELALSAESVEEGEQLLAQALALEPDIETRGHLLIHRATLLRRRGEHEAARKQFQALIEDPHMPPSVTQLARELINALG